MLVGTAEVLVVADTSAFEKQLKDETDPAFQGLRDDAEAAGADAGVAIRTGAKDEAGKLEDDLGDIGAASGGRLREGVKAGSSGLEDDLANLGTASGQSLRSGLNDETSKLESDLGDVGAAGGLNLRKGVTEETEKLADDVGKDAEEAGAKLHSGIGSGLSKLANLISNTGLPLEPFTVGLEKAGDAAHEADSKAGGLAGTLDKVGGVALAGAAAGFAVLAGVGVHMAEGMQTAEASIASAQGTSVSAARKIGDAFLGTAGQTEFGAEKIADAYAQVAGQLKSTEGHALDSADALKVMDAAMDLATAKGLDLGDATQTVVGIMQAFQLPASEAAHVSDVLFQASAATGQSVDALGSSLERVRSKLGETAGGVGDLAGLMVDMTDRGITGRAALAALNSGMNTLEKSATGVQTAISDQTAAYDQLPSSLKKLADSYRDGTMTSEEFTKATEGLPPAQAQLLQSFASSTTAVASAQLKFKEMGVTAFTASGQFVGMGSIIDQLHPKFALMSQDQQLAAASALFGAGAARQMVEVINAGPAAFDAATDSVNKMGAAHNAAAEQAKTLHVEEETLEAEMGDLATRVGSVLIPVLTTLVGWFTKGTAFVAQHQAALIALAAVVTGILGPAIAVFTINKMAAFGESFVSAGKNVSSFASGVQSAVKSVIGMFTEQTAAAEDASGAIEENAAKSATATSEAATAIEGDNATAGASFTAMAGESTTAAGTVGTETAAMATDTSGAATTIEADNTTAGASFTTMAGEADTASAGIGTAVAGEATAVTTADSAIEAENTAAGASFAGVLSGVAATAAAGVAGFGLGTIVGHSGGATGQPGGKPTKQQQQAGLPGTIMTPSTTPLPSTSTSGSGNSDVTRWASDAQRASALTGVPASLLLADINQESGGTPVHSTGSTPGQGNLTQFLPSTAKEYGVKFGTTPADIQSQITGQAEYLKALGALTNPTAALEGYNSGTPGDKVSAGYASSVLANQGAYKSYNLNERTSFRQGAGGNNGPAPLPSPSTAESQASAAAVASTKAASAAEKAAVEAAAHEQTAAVHGATTLQIDSARDSAHAQVTAMQGAAAAQKTEAKQQTSDVRAGTSQLNRTLAAIHSGSLSSLKTALNTVHSAAMSQTEKALDRDHSTALATLSRELVAVHQKAMDELVKDEKAAAAKEAATKAADAKAAAAAAATAAASAAATAAQQANQLTADQAKQQADAITDASKVYLDQQAQAGLSGAALVAAQAQTAYDQVAQSSDAAIDAAQVAVDQAASGSAAQQQAAAAQLAQAQATAQIQEAAAQAQLDQANAASSAATAASSSTTSTAATTSTATATSPTINLNIYGNGNMTASQLFQEIGYAITTGALPIAPPPVPVAG